MKTVLVGVRVQRTCERGEPRAVCSVRGEGAVGVFQRRAAGGKRVVAHIEDRALVRLKHVRVGAK